MKTRQVFGSFCQKCVRNGAKNLIAVSQLSVLYSTDNSDTLSENLMALIAPATCHVTPCTNNLNGDSKHLGTSVIKNMVYARSNLKWPYYLQRCFNFCQEQTNISSFDPCSGYPLSALY
jgi:hypothetical protein